MASQSPNPLLMKELLAFERYHGLDQLLDELLLRIAQTKASFVVTERWQATFAIMAFRLPIPVCNPKHGNGGADA